jgi:hypothetical protein
MGNSIAINKPDKPILFMDIIKSHGSKVRFDPNRIIKTCMRSGLSIGDAEEVAKIVESKIYEGITTRKILKITISEIRKKDKNSATKYDLKGAIMRLGPDGFVFEKFVSKVLQSEGYKTKTNIIVTGACVQHEIDIIAEKIKKSMIECKYHNSSGIYTGIKDILYTYARFLDLKEGYSSGKCENFSEAWVASNTKFSLDAIQYASCKGMTLLGWNYPQENSLAKMIERNKIYPITILKSVSPEIKKELLKYNIVTIKDILTKKPKIKNISQVLSEVEQLTNQ